MFSRFQRSWGSRGSMSEVWIDYDAGLCKKLYKPNGVTITGNAPMHTSNAEIKMLFDAEIKWTNLLPESIVLKPIEYGELENEYGFYILQPYIGPDLLTFHANKTLMENFPDISDQIVEMFSIFKEFNLHKLNNALSNLTGVNKSIKAFDFKYAVERADESKKYEEYSINTWLHKIDPVLPRRLLDLI